LLLRLSLVKIQNNSAREEEIRNFIWITSCLTLVSVKVHSSSFLLKKHFKEGDILLIENLIYEYSYQYDSENNKTHILSKDIKNEDGKKSQANII